MSAEEVVTVAEINGAVVAFSASRDGWLNHLYVLPQHQRHGIGTRLLQAVQRNCPALQLWVFHKNEPARRFYEKHGFTLVALTEGATNEEREPDAKYLWQTRVEAEPGS